MTGATRMIARGSCVAAAVFAFVASSSGQEADRDRAALGSGDPIRIAAAARHAAENARRDLVDDLIAALDRLPVRNEASSASDPGRALDSYLPQIIFDALVVLQSRPSPQLLASWWARKKEYVPLRDPLIVLIARDPSANADLLSEALSHWEDEFVLGAVAADHFRRTDPRRLVAATIGRRLVEIRIRVVDPANRTLIGSGFACGKSRWPEVLPKPARYEFKFEAKDGFEPLLTGGVPLFWRREVSDRKSWCDWSEGDHPPRSGEITSWREAALANLRAVAGLDIAAGLPRGDQFLVHDWKDESDLREFVAAQRRRTEGEWSALLNRLVDVKALEATEVASLPVRIRIKVIDGRKDDDPELHGFDSE